MAAGATGIDDCAIAVVDRAGRSGYVEMLMIDGLVVAVMEGRGR